MKKKFTYIFPLLFLFALVCIYALAQTNTDDRKQKPTNSNLSVAETPTGEQNTAQSNYVPKDGYVPDEQTAIAIAVAVWIPIYSKETIESEKPYRASLKKGVWTVTGSLRKGYDKGGTAIAEISKKDGQILRIIHGK